jgi:glycosyltransferase involved in cell wall biosynthesis
MGGIWVGTFIDDIAHLKTERNFIFVHFAFDMIPTLFPGYVVDWLPSSFTNYQKSVFTIADGVIAISKSTENDVKNFITEYKISNLPEICTVRIAEDIVGSDIYSSGYEVMGELKWLNYEEFILCVITIEVRKNYTALFYVVKEAEARGVNLPKIVIVGRAGWLTDDIRYMMTHDKTAQSKITHLSNVDDLALDWLYKNCRFTVFPSFYEGWGMPVAEALSYGKLCLASNTSSIPEIAGTLIDYFSPYDTGDILNKISRYLDDNALMEKENKIRSKYKKTSWDDMYEEVSNFVRSLNP